MPFTTWASADLVTAAKLNNDNSVAVGTDTARTISVTHTWTAAQTFTGGWTAAAACAITSSSATSFAVGLNGSTNPAFLVDASTASSATGLKVKSAAAAAGLALSVITSGTNENLTIDAAGSGTITLAGTSTGAVIVGVGQLKFPATQNASADANTLDDYEEGSWTPIDSSGAALTFTTPTGAYEKIGRLVIARGSLTYPVTANGSNATIGGLPFTVANTEEARQGFVSLSDETTLKFIALVKSGTTMTLRDSAAASLTNATMSTNVVYFTAIYYI